MCHPSGVKATCEDSRVQAWIIRGYRVYQSEQRLLVVKGMLPLGHGAERPKVGPRSLLRFIHPVVEGLVSNLG